MNGNELVLSKWAACDGIIDAGCVTVVAATVASVPVVVVRRPSPISSSSSLLLLTLLIVFIDRCLDIFVIASSSWSEESLLDDG